LKYLLVHPDYQSQSLGKALVHRILDTYKACARKVLIAYDGEVEFYENCGFTIGSGKTPMFVTCLEI